MKKQSKADKAFMAKAQTLNIKTSKGSSLCEFCGLPLDDRHTRHRKPRDKSDEDSFAA